MANSPLPFSIHFFRILLHRLPSVLCLVLCLSAAVGASATERQPITAAYFPIADHYAGIVAYEKYRQRMVHADYRIESMKSWPLLRAYFRTGEIDMAYIICPEAMDMFREKPDFRWVSLMHRDGNALAINDLLDADARLASERKERKPDQRVVDALVKAKQQLGRPSQCGVPHLHATHTVILYKYLKDHGKTLAIGRGTVEDVVAVEVLPAQSPAFIKQNNSRGIPASFEQSLPWADVVETGGYGKVAWYSKDVLPWPHGHVECIAIATDQAIRDKHQAVQEVVRYIHQAGQDIEQARQSGGAEMDAIVAMIRRHIPAHSPEAIVQSLRTDLDVINYRHLNVDKNAKDSLRQIMGLALEGGILRQAIDIEAFADESFASEVTGR